MENVLPPVQVSLYLHWAGGRAILYQSYDSFCTEWSSQGRVHSKYPWKAETVSPSRAERRLVFWPGKCQSCLPWACCWHPPRGFLSFLFLSSGVALVSTMICSHMALAELGTRGWAHKGPTVCNALSNQLSICTPCFLTEQTHTAVLPAAAALPICSRSHHLLLHPVLSPHSSVLA